jgi:undecaprenyl diphosphate synthase
MAGWAYASGLEVFSFWWGSPANLQRRSQEERIVESLAGWLQQEAPSLLETWDAEVEVIGRWRELCPSLEPVVEGLPSRKGRRRLVVLMAYDGQEELLAAARTGPQSREALQRALWTAGLPPVDLVLRTGGEPHLSAGFLLWQIAEAQLAFSDTLWPAMQQPEFLTILQKFSGIPRRYGA